MISSREQAETVAVQALGWIAANQDLMGSFLAASGMAVDDLRESAADADVLAAVMDFLLTDEAAVTGFCGDHGYGFETALSVRLYLPGGDNPNWT